MEGRRHTWLDWTATPTSRDRVSFSPLFFRPSRFAKHWLDCRTFYLGLLTPLPVSAIQGMIQRPFWGPNSNLGVLLTSRWMGSCKEVWTGRPQGPRHGRQSRTFVLDPQRCWCGALGQWCVYDTSSIVFLPFETSYFLNSLGSPFRFSFKPICCFKENSSLPFWAPQQKWYFAI